MLSVLVPAHPEGPARLLAMGSVCCSGGIVLTRILSCKVSCRILDATLSSFTPLRRACFEGFESPKGWLDSSSLLSSFSDLLSPPLLGLLDLSEVVLSRPESTACGPVVCIAKFSPAFSFLWDSPARARCNSSVLGGLGHAPLDGFFGGVTFCHALAPVAKAGAMTTRTITLSVAL